MGGGPSGVLYAEASPTTLRYLTSTQSLFASGLLRINNQYACTKLYATLHCRKGGEILHEGASNSEPQKEPEEDFDVKGSLSTKMEAVIKTLLKVLSEYLCNVN